MRPERASRVERVAPLFFRCYDFLTMSKKNTLTLILVLALGTTSCFPFSFKPKSSEPKLEVDTTQHDFGTIPATDTVQTVFKVRNTGGKTLEISRIQTSCGCTAAMMGSQSLKPGESSPLKVTFDPRGKAGRQARTLWLFTNDPDPANAQKQLVIQADIQALTPMQQPKIQVLPTTSMPQANGSPMQPSQSIAVPTPEVSAGVASPATPAPITAPAVAPSPIATPTPAPSQPAKK